MNALKLAKSFICGLIFSTVLGGTVLTANAISTSKSNIMNATANAVSYNAYSSVTTGINAYGQNYASAFTYAYATNVSSLQAGVVKVKARLYYSGGALALEEGWKSSSANSTGIGTTAMLFDADSSKSYYSRGRFQVYNGDNYDIYTTYKSPSLDDFT